MSDWDALSIIHGKMLGCSNDAVATFWRVVTWARGPGAQARPGFVNEKQLRAWAGNISTRRFREVVSELVDAGKPQHDHGLLDPDEGGWWIHDFAHYGTGVGLVAALGPMPVDAGASPDRSAVSAARAAAGRVGGKRSAESRAASKQTAQPPSKRPKQTPEANGFASKQTPEAKPGSSSPVASSRSLEIREIPKENHHPKDLPASRAGEVCFDDEDVFERLGLGERAALCTEDPRFASRLRPHRWPEVIAVVKAFVEATGRPRNIVAYDRDTGVQAVVALLAAYDLERLLAIVPKAVSSPWWLEKPGRSLSELSLRVVEIAFENDAGSARAEAEAARLLSLVPRKASGPPAPVGLLVPVATGGNS
jgi:hypothetical protein